MQAPNFLTRWLVRAGLGRFHPRARRALGPGVEQLRHLSDLALNLPLEGMRLAAAATAAMGSDVIDLALGAPQVEAAKTTAARPAGERPGTISWHGLVDLREAISKHLQKDRDLVRHADDEILVTAGAAGALQTVLATFVNPGDRIVLFGPTSPLLYLMTQARGARIRWVPTQMESGKLHFRADILAQSLRGARMILFSNPANPQGGILSAEDLEQIAWWADRRDCLIYSDDSFASFAYDTKPLAMATLPKAFRRALHAGSMSKAFSQPALRVGWLSAERSLLRPCLAVQAVQFPQVPHVCQQAALTLLQSPSNLESLRGQLQSRRQYCCERLRGAGLMPGMPAGGFFLWVDISRSGLSGQAFAERLLQEKRVRVTPGLLFGPSGGSHIRLSFAVEDGRLREGLSRFLEFISSRGQRLPDRVARAAA